MTSDPGYPDAHHGRVGPVQAVTTVTACRKAGAKSGRHDDTPPPRRWSRFKPSPWGQFRLSRRYKAEAVNAEANAYYFDHSPEPYGQTPDIEAHRDSFDIIGYQLEPGDVAVFNFHLLHHAGAAENSKTKRRALSIVYGDDSVTMRHRPNMVPTQHDAAGRTYADGQSVSEFPDLFPAI